MPEAPQNIQDGIARMELEGSIPTYAPAPTHTPVNDGLGNQWHSQNGTYSQGGSAPQAQQLPNHQAYPHNTPSNYETPNFSPFPKLQNPPPNVPPSDDEKEAILWDARLPVLNSNDPEMQLAWAQDALAYVDAAMTHEARISESQPARSQTPQIEHQLRIDAMNIVSFLADQHHPKAEFMKGMWLEFGKFGQRQDKREAFRCYQRASERGYSRAEYRMGMQFEQSNDPMKALQHYKRGAEAGDSASNYRLGMMTLLGQAGQQQDYARGVQLLKQAASTADENAPQGAYVLGMLQAHELHQVQVPEHYLPYDEKMAKANVEKAAYLGFAKAQLKMGSAYELSSMGCEFSPALSLHYNALASRQGEIEADMAISKWFLAGYEGLFPKNEELAFTYVQRAAVAHLPTAMFGLGYFYEVGISVPQNSQKALEWYEKAAQAGNKDAEGRLKVINSTGQTMSRSDHENVALGRIRSQFGSKRGGRPPRLSGQPPVPSLPSIADDESRYSQADSGDQWSNQQNHLGKPPGLQPLPPRVSSVAPYPQNDQLPGPIPSNRPPTVAPYPVNDGPPRLGLPGGFAQEMRPSSVPYSHPQHDNYGPRPGLSAGPSQWQDRPHTAYDSYGSGPQGPPAQRIVSGPPAGQRPYNGPGGFQQSPAVPPKEPIRPNTTLNIGYQAPEQNPARARLQKQGGLQGKQVGPGYDPRVSPLNVQKRTNAPQAPSSQGNYPPRVSSGGVSQGRVSQPPSNSGLRPNPQGQSRPSPNGPSAVAGGRPQNPSSGPAGAAQKPAPRPPGTGPKTFDDMGVPNKKKDEECVSATVPIV